jgi:circadian clock protein KaiC
MLVFEPRVQLTMVKMILTETYGAAGTQSLPKAASGIKGLDELTGGGLPKGRPTLVCGGPGCGKTMLAVGFLVHGAIDENEPGVLISFDEAPADLEVNSRSLGYDLAGLEAKNLLAIDHVHLDLNDVEESGEFDLEGLFIRIDLAVRKVGAKRVVLDTIDTIFSGLPNEMILRSELRRLFRWLKDRGLTTVVTAERGTKAFTRHGIEEYISDCVILLDHRVHDEISTRRLRVVKYRGSLHGTNEYPFIIGSDGIAVLPITSLGLIHEVSEQRVSSGVPGLDALLEDRGYFKGSSILVSGGPGSGKTSFSAHFANAACARGESCLIFSFEEAPNQLIRNMRTVGIDLGKWIERGRLHCSAARPTEYGLETHLAAMHQEIRDRAPDIVVVDPVSALLGTGTHGQTELMVLRLIDYLKSLGITALFVNLQHDAALLNTNLNVSSLMDTWMVLRTYPEADQNQRRIQIIKSRGMSHPLEPTVFEITSEGVRVNAAELV